jgi:hypothetical protein
MAQKSKCSTSIRSDFEITTFIQNAVKILAIPNDSTSNSRMSGAPGHLVCAAGGTIFEAVLKFQVAHLSRCVTDGDFEFGCDFSFSFTDYELIRVKLQATAASNLTRDFQTGSLMPRKRLKVRSTCMFESARECGMALHLNPDR